MSTNIAIQTAKPKDKTYRLSDRGLYLEIAPRDSKLWRLKCRFHGKAKRISFGKFPDVSLKEARTLRDEARGQLSQGIDPSMLRKKIKFKAQQQSLDSFDAIAREWWEKQEKEWVKSYSSRTLSRLERDLFPFMGKRPMAEIPPQSC